MSSFTLHYRPGTLEDISSMMELGKISYGQYATVLTIDNWLTLNKFLHNEAAYTDMINRSSPFVCEHNGQMVGMAFLIPSGNPTDIYDKDWSYIRMVGVHPGYAGQGIGKKVTELCIAQAKTLKEQTIALHTSEFMDAARHIYEQLGFSILKEIPQRLGKRYWLYTMNIAH